MRNLGQLITDMLTFIPEDNVLRNDFKSIMSSIPYSPPESMLCWERAQEAIVIELGEYPSEEWHYEILSIWTALPIEQLKSEVAKSKELKGVEMSDLIDEYFQTREKVFESFGYVEDWKRIPLDDCRMYYWKLFGEGPGFVHFSEDKDEAMHYENEIYTQRFLPKWVYRNEKYTMIAVDTHTDGNKLLSIFDNEKEVK